MSSTTLPGHVSGLLNRERTIAGIGFSRWMVPPAALCVHLCIGQAYAFSVFNLPMTKLIGITQSAPDDWKLTDLGWIFSIAIFFLGVSAAVLGRWVEEGGPRRAMFTAGAVLGGRLPGLGARRLRPQHLAGLSRLRRARRMRAGHRLHLAGLDADQMVSRPARHGDRHGDHGLRRRRLHRLAALGLADAAVLHADTHVGVAETFVVLGVIYFCFMMVGAAIVRLPPPGWKPAGYVAAGAAASKLITTQNVFVYQALKTPQFWLIWWVLCLNVTAGIGVLGQASAMSQEMFPGKVTVTAAAASSA